MPPNRSRTPLIIAIIAGVACLGLALIVVIALVIGGVLFTSGDDGDEQGGSSSSSSQELVPPPGVAEDQPYLELGTSADGPVVDVYVDFLCPHCATFEDLHGEDLTQLASDGEITLRVHPRPMLDANSSPAGYSSRAANAAVCAYAEDPAQWSAAETALFENQPGEEGLTDEELTSVIDEATGLDVSSCITEGTYVPWIQDVVEPEALETTQGTPTVLIDGEMFTGDLAEPGSVRSAIEQA
ncbi:DsbA family protein [Brachybacterium sacelli]|uniref:Protein-disulfide isomerase n=1 Tax=Brachybacterium sacelli TaxID=173364 RepID=A0ABS4WWS8_9MICO|nr:thioredoxin domain-containing protein [Brachybacterium sacelli]MBP2380546.1 protein-disulfide isomerase [Brachybacterium sacelli]